MFPVFTVYVTSLYDRQQQRGMRVAEDTVNQKQDEQ
jgi:hypothetical protein